MIEGIIPVIRGKEADLLLDDMEKNTVPPGRVIVIDNTGCGYFPTTRLPVLYVRPPAPLGVNASWNIGAALAVGEFVSILNDDIRINQRFFEGICGAFSSCPESGVVCPQTTDNPMDVRPNPCADYRQLLMSKREGWAFTIRRELLDRIPPIPEELKIFCGDDWYWHWARKLGRVWVKQNGNIIYHRPGASAGPEARHFLKAEKNLFAKLIREAK
jgi:GT2 family glycosyltransferase